MFINVCPFRIDLMGIHRGAYVTFYSVMHRQTNYCVQTYTFYNL